MNEVQRHNGILSLLEENQTINVAHIIERFNVSPATARRDISKLNELGKVRKVRNGAERIEMKHKTWMPLNLNNTEHYEEKYLIAKQAAALCQPNDSVVINCGSTAFLLGKQLCHQEVQIVTNYFPLASYLINKEHEDVILIGGQYNRSQNIFLNPTPNSLGSYAGNWMFTSGKGLTATGLYKSDMLTAVAEQQTLEQVDKLVVVVDSSKVGHRTGMLFCQTERIDVLITGKNANQEVIKAIEEQGTQVILV
ncbi:Glycerol-3-phosphate regulon repressor (plasmid) [Vibrio scophthalmi]|uniref:HTH-type transcriptional regulator UlaR n=1 Tax=Vibrio scophthalmi TaxID=45658 RepID=UPI0008099052|nr:HTH-type transcriptional regulator UlaR [Vibrio scophthalmi]ANS88249.1 Glycerol-3-phosphate regulon repressor [Vibrio scophthalmi]ANS88276.1 Glycerol-3-phosphate regulon repressor [Vibrio scophthalmi]